MQQSEVKPQAGLAAIVAGVDAATGLNWTLRIACSMCFIGHGAWGVITKAGWLPFYEVFGVPEWLAWHTMPLIGTMDITLGIMVLFHPCRAVLAYMIFWASFTALLRPLAGMGWWELLERGGNYGPPLAFYLIAQAQGCGWFDRVEPAALSRAALGRVRWTLQISIALLMIGHGGFGAFQQKQMLIEHWTSIGVAADATFVRVVGAGEILAGVAVLFVTTRSFLLLLAVYKAASEFLYPIAGKVVDTWEWVERGGDYAAPVALIFALAMLNESTRSPAFAGKTASAGALRALCVGAASALVTIGIVVAYWVGAE